MRKGFTLVELLVVVMVIAILATIAVPQYIKATERANGGKARNAIALIAQGEKLYRAENSTYVAVAADNANAILGSYVELQDVDADTGWTYVVGGVAAATFTITATRVGGPNAGETLTLTQDGTWAGTFTP